MSSAEWLASLRMGDKVIVQTTWQQPFVGTVQAISKVAVFADNLCFRFQGEQKQHAVSREGWRQAWLIRPTDELLEEMQGSSRRWDKLEWDAFSEKLSAIPGSFQPDLPPLAVWEVFGVGDRFNRFKPARLTDPLFWEEPRTVVFGDADNSVDLFDKAVDNEAIHRIFAIMALCPQHTFIVRTGSPERMRHYNDDCGLEAEAGGSTWPSSGIGQAASDMIWSDWIEKEGKPFRKALEDLVYLADGLEPGTDCDAPSDHDLLPLPNVTFKAAESPQKAEAGNA